MWERDGALATPAARRGAAKRQADPHPLPDIIISSESEPEDAPPKKKGKPTPSPDNLTSPAPSIPPTSLDDTALLRAALADFQEFLLDHKEEKAAQERLLQDIDAACERVSAEMAAVPTAEDRDRALERFFASRSSATRGESSESDSDSEWDDAETSARKTSPVDELDEDQEDSSNRRELMDVE